jgi:hypothetical protein
MPAPHSPPAAWPHARFARRFPRGFGLFPRLALGTGNLLDAEDFALGHRHPLRMRNRRIRHRCFRFLLLLRFRFRRLGAATYNGFRTAPAAANVTGHQPIRIAGGTDNFLARSTRTPACRRRRRPVFRLMDDDLGFPDNPGADTFFDRFRRLSVGIRIGSAL